MAVTIIKRGTPPQERRFEAVCSTCDTVFSFLQSDGKLTSDQRDGDFINIQCPICGRQVCMALYRTQNTGLYR